MAGYWPLGEDTGSVAANVADGGTGNRDGVYHGDVTMGVPGALAGSADVGAGFDGSTGTTVQLPRNLVNSQMAYTVELWFKADPGATGVLFGHQSSTLGDTSSGQNWNPMLLVDPDGFLRGKGYTESSGTTQMVSPGQVDDGQWHHAVLSVRVDHQELYLDGVLVDQVSGLVVFHQANSQLFVGNGRASSGWGLPPTGDHPFTGHIDEVAVYYYPLAATSVAAHWDAGATTHRLTMVTEPGEFVSKEITYDEATGRVASVTDRHGEEWTLDEPEPDGDEVAVVVSAAGAGSVTYRYDMAHGGRLVSREDTFGEQSWEYNAAGFVSKAIDQNGNAASFATDERGNVTGRTTCEAVGECATEYFGYFHNPAEPLDPRNDVLIWEADGRSSGPSDTTYRTSYELDDAGRVIEVTHPTPDGHTTPPVESFSYSTGGTAPAYGFHSEPRTFIPANDAVVPITGSNDEVAVALPFPVTVYGESYTSVSIATWGDLHFEGTGSLIHVCVLCENWDVDAAASVRTGTVGTAPERQFVVEWRDVVHVDTPTLRVSMQAVFSENGEIAFNYDLPAGVDQLPGLVVMYREHGEDAFGPERIPGFSDDIAIVFTPTAGGESYEQTEEPRAFIPAASSPLSLWGDDEIEHLALPFDISHYGEIYNDVWISTNGFASFSPTDCWCSWATPIPSPTEPNAAVYPLWDDLVVYGPATVHTEVRGTAPERTFVIEWREVALLGGSWQGSFQVLLAEDGEVAFNYAGIDGLLDEPWAAPVVGVENAAGDDAVSILPFHYGAADGVAYVFTPAEPEPPAGLLTESVGVNGGVTMYEYDWRGDLVRTTDPVGLVEEFSYDGLGRPVSTTSSDGTESYGTATYTYNDLSQVETVTYPPVTNPVTNVTHTEVVTHTYDDAGRRTGTSVSDATGGDTTRVWEWDYDPAGRLVSTTAPDGAVSLQEWDSRGDVVKVTEPGGLVLEHVYDGAHRLVETAAVGPDVDPLDEHATRLVLESRAYDPAGRLAAVTDAMGQETAYTYYDNNLPATVTRVHRDEHHDVVDTVLLAELEYNEAGMLIVSTTAGGVVTEYGYDPAGFLAWEYFDPWDVERVRVYERNLDGSVAAVESFDDASWGHRHERTEYTYDLAGRLLTETVDNIGSPVATALTTSYERDVRGLVTLQTDPAGTRTWFDYDDRGRAVAITGEPRDVWSAGVLTADVSPVSLFGRNTFGEVTHEQDPTGAVTALVLDEVGRSVELHLPEYTPPGGSPILAVESTQYDDRGLPVMETDALGRVTSYEYDAYGRLVSRTLPDPDGAGPLEPPVWSYGYDRLGRLVETTDPTGGQVLATYDDLDRQITETVTDRTTGSTVFLTTELGYDDAGNLTSVKTPLGRTTTTTYNAAGEPVRITGSVRPVRGVLV